MSNNNFSRRRRGMRFRPKGGFGQAPQKPDREAVQARADVVTEQGGAEHVFEKRHSNEIERAENIAAGLPPQGAPETPTPDSGADKKDSASQRSKRRPGWRRKNPSSPCPWRNSPRAFWTPSNSPPPPS